MLGGEELYRKARGLMEQKPGLEEAQWTKNEEVSRRRERVRALVKTERDERIQVWARLRLGNEQGVDLAREYDYANSSGITLLVRRLEAAAAKDRRLQARLEELRTLACKPRTQQYLILNFQIKS